MNNFESCLNKHQASPNHAEWCMPQVKPEECLNESWTEMKNVFHGIRCPPVKVAMNAGDHFHIWKRILKG